MPPSSPPGNNRTKKSNKVNQKQSLSGCSNSIKQAMSKLNSVLMQGSSTAKRSSNSNNSNNYNINTSGGKISNNSVVSHNNGSIISLRMRSKLSGMPLSSTKSNGVKNKLLLQQSVSLHKKGNQIQNRSHQQQSQINTQPNYQQENESLIVDRKLKATVMKRQPSRIDDHDGTMVTITKGIQANNKSESNSKKRIKNKVLSFAQNNNINYEQIQNKLQKYRLRKQNYYGEDNYKYGENNYQYGEDNHYIRNHNYSEMSNYSNSSTFYLKPIDSGIQEVIEKSNKKNSKISNHTNNHNAKTHLNAAKPNNNHNNQTNKKQKPLISYSLLLSRIKNNSKNLSIKLKDHLKYNHWLQIKHQKLSTHHHLHHQTKKISNDNSQKQHNHLLQPVEKHQPLLLLRSHSKNKHNNNSKQKSRQKSSAERKSLSVKKRDNKSLSSFYIEKNQNHKITSMTERSSRKKMNHTYKENNLNQDNLLLLGQGKEGSDSIIQTEVNNQNRTSLYNMANHSVIMANNSSTFLDSLSSQQLYNSKPNNSNSKNSNYHSKSSQKQRKSSSKTNTKNKHKHNQKNQQQSNKKYQLQYDDEDQKLDSFEIMRNLHKKYEIEQLTRRLKQQLKKISSAIKESKELTSKKVKKHNNNSNGNDRNSNGNDSSSIKKLKNKKKKEIIDRRNNQNGSSGRSQTGNRQIVNNQNVLLQNNNNWDEWLDKYKNNDNDIRVLNFQSGRKLANGREYHQHKSSINRENNNDLYHKLLVSKGQEREEDQYEEKRNPKKLEQLNRFEHCQQTSHSPSKRISIKKQVQQYRERTDRQEERQRNNQYQDPNGQQKSEVITIGKDEFATPVDDQRMTKQHNQVLIKQIDDHHQIEGKDKIIGIVSQKDSIQSMKMETVFNNISISSNNENQNEQQQQQKQQQQELQFVLINDDNNMFIEFATVYITILMGMAHFHGGDYMMNENNEHRQIGINGDEIEYKQQSELLQNLSRPLGCGTIELLRMMRQYCMVNSQQQYEYECEKQEQQQQYHHIRQQQPQQQSWQQQKEYQQHLSQQRNQLGQQLESITTHNYQHNQNDDGLLHNNPDSNNSQYIIRPQIYTHLQSIIIAMLSDCNYTPAAIILYEYFQQLRTIIGKMQSNSNHHQIVSSQTDSSSQMLQQHTNQQSQHQHNNISSFYQQYLSPFSLALYDATNSILDQLRPFGTKGLPPIHYQSLYQERNQHSLIINISKVKQYLFAKLNQQIFAIKLGIIIQDHNKQVLSSASTSALANNEKASPSYLNLPKQIIRQQSIPNNLSNNQSYQSPPSFSVNNTSILPHSTTPMRLTKQQDQHIKAQKLSQLIKSYLNKQSIQISKQLQLQYGYLQDVRFQIIYQLQIEIQQEIFYHELITIGELLNITY